MSEPFLGAGLPLEPGEQVGTLAEREPVRLPLWASIAGSQTFAFLIALLTGSPWKPALAAVLAALGPLLFGVEVARRGAWSPLSVLAAAEAARQDERSSDGAAG